MTARSDARRWSGLAPRAAVLLGLLLGAGAARPALAAPDAADATARARTAFQEGLRLEEGGSYAEALARFREVAAVKKTPQVLFHIGVCLEKTGALVEALDAYRQASQLAASATAEVKKPIDEALASLDRRAPSLTITRGKGARNASVLLDGKPLDDLREPLRLPPGKHVVQARARNKDNFRAEVVLTEGQRATVELVLDDLDTGEPAARRPAAVEGPEALPPEAAPARRSIAPYVVLGVGVGSLALGGAFYALRSSKKSELEDQCAGTTCPTSARSTGDTLTLYNTLSNVTVGVGLAGVATGVIWLLARPDAPAAPARSARLRLDPGASPAPLGVGLSGGW